MSPEEQLKLYESDVNAEQRIRDAITKSYGDLKEESDLVHTYENEQFPSFYSALNGYGAQSAGLDPLTLLQNAWGEQGRMATAAQVARDAFDIRKAGMEDLIKTTQNQWAMGYQGAQNAYDRWWAQKQHEDALKEAARQRAAAYAAANVARNYTPTPTPGPQSNQDRLRNLYQQGIRVDPLTGKQIVGMSLPGGGDALWTIDSPTQGTTIGNKKPTKVTVGSPNLSINALSSVGNGYYTPVPQGNTLINKRFVR